MWELINTAPRDGTRILAWCGGYADICYTTGDEERWMTDFCADFGGHETPTHWMPLPTKPKG
ncbi:MAG: DUF551 domain-containing protein [Bacteroidales bacterium]